LRIKAIFLLQNAGNHKHNLANNTAGEGVVAKLTMGIGSCRR